MISTILAKIAKNEELNPYELDELNRWGQRSEQSVAEVFRLSDIVSRWDRGGILRTTILTRNTDATIAHDTETAVSFESAFLGGAAGWDIADPTKIYRSGSRPVAIMGEVEWETNSSGRRSIHINCYNSAGVNQWGITLASMLPNGTGNDVFPFFNYISETANITDYYQVTVLQTSGGDLDMTDCKVVAIEL